MEKTKKKIVHKIISPYSVQQAFIGLGLKETDDSTLRYLNFLGRQIPIAAAYFLHVLPKYDLLTAIYEKETQMLLSDYSIGEDRREQMKEEIKSALSNWSEVLIQLSKGSQFFCVDGVFLFFKPTSEHKATNTHRNKNMLSC
jgi:hypothetical protein